MTVTENPTNPVPPGGPAGRGHPGRAAGRLLPQGRVPRLLTALAAAWLVPVLAFYAHAAFLLPLVIWVGTASLLRGGRSVLDRLVLAFALLFGAMCAGGLLFSMWPWGLHPIPVAGLAFTVLVAVAAGTGRGPRLPRRTVRGDVTALVVTAGVTVLMVWPLLGRGWSARLSTLVIAEDLARHFSLFDNIRLYGGYTFLHKEENAESLRESLVAYPQGSHFLMALLDGFGRSSTAAGSSQSALDHFLVFYVATFVLLVGSVLWAIRWIAGPAMSPWRYVPVAAAAAGYLFFGDGVAMFMRGFPSEFAGLALLALLVAVTARPLRGTREQTLVVAALVVGIAFTYYLFLPLVGIGALVWVVVYRQRLLARPLFTGVVALATIVLVLVPPVVNLKYASSTEELNAPGGISPVNRHLLFGLLIVAGAGFLARRTWRHPVRRTAGVWLAVAAGTALLMFTYQTVALGETSYYYEKLLHQLFVVGLVALGTSVLLVPRWGRHDRPARVMPVTGPVAAFTAAACLLAALGMTAGPDRNVWRKPPKERSWGVSWVLGDLDQPAPANAVAAARAAAADPGDHVGLLQIKGDWQSNYFGSLWLGVLSRDYGSAWPAWTPLGRQEKPDAIKEWLTAKAPLRIRVFTNDPDTYRAVQELRRERPDLGVELMWSSPVRCTFAFAPVAAPAPGAAPIPAPAVPAPGERGCGARG